MMGRIGTILGDAGINIARLQLGSRGSAPAKPSAS